LFEPKNAVHKHISVGFRPDLLWELTELGWLDPLAGCRALREGGKEREWEDKRGGKEDKA